VRSFKKAIAFTALLSILFSFCGVGVLHFDIDRSNFSEIIGLGIYDWDLRTIACAAPEGKIPAENNGVNNGVPDDQSDDSGIKKRDYHPAADIIGSCYKYSSCLVYKGKNETMRVRSVR